MAQELATPLEEVEEEAWEHIEGLLKDVQQEINDLKEMYEGEFLQALANQTPISQCRRGNARSGILWVGFAGWSLDICDTIDTARP